MKMGENIFKKIETEREVPQETKDQIISKISDMDKGKEASRLFHTKFYGAIVNFFKLR